MTTPFLFRAGILAVAQAGLDIEATLLPQFASAGVSPTLGSDWSFD